MFGIFAPLPRGVPLLRSMTYLRRASTTASIRTMPFLFTTGVKSRFHIIPNHISKATYSSIKSTSERTSNTPTSTSTVPQLLEAERSEALKAYPDLSSRSAQNKIILEFAKAHPPFIKKTESDAGMTQEEFQAFDSLQHKALAAQSLQDTSNSAELYQERQEAKRTWTEAVTALESGSDNTVPVSQLSDKPSLAAADLPRLLGAERKEALTQFPHLADPSIHARILEDAEETMKPVTSETKFSHRQYKKLMTLQLQRLAVESLRDESGDVRILENRLRLRRKVVEDMKKNGNSRMEWWMRMLGINLAVNAFLQLLPF